MEEDRAWTILIVFNQGRVALIPGYGVEPWIAGDQWQRILGEMTAPWSDGKRRVAILRFFDAAEKALRVAWKRVTGKFRNDHP